MMEPAQLSSLTRTLRQEALQESRDPLARWHQAREAERKALKRLIDALRCRPHHDPTVELGVYRLMVRRRERAVRALGCLGAR